MDKIQEPTLEERNERDYKLKERELKIARMRAELVRRQISDAYEILENIRFDYLSDTAFREKIVKAKIGCENAIGDFLLDDGYWKNRIDEHRKLTSTEYVKQKENKSEPMSSFEQRLTELEIVKNLLPKQKIGDEIGFRQGKKHYKVKRDE